MLNSLRKQFVDNDFLTTTTVNNYAKNQLIEDFLKEMEAGAQKWFRKWTPLEEPS